MGMENEPRDVFASDLGWVDVLGKNVRINLVVDRFQCAGAPAERRVVAQIIMPLDVLPGAIQRILFAVGTSPEVIIHPAPRLLS